MNYLAHLHLAKVSGTSYCGNLLGDFASELDRSKLPKEVVLGIKMHQHIDKTIDSHTGSFSFRENQTIGRRRFVGIVLDILLDYWLVNKWQQFNSTPLDAFYDDFLPDLHRYHDLCPPRLQGLITSLDHKRWLADLGQLSGVEKALQSIMRRWRYGHHLQPFYEDLPLLLTMAETTFDQVYPDLMVAAKAPQE
ncbi:DUF479 domain-containing protein [Marinomonas agarivorans]|nr:DUF479 domain-containing protein [Marinomonas agarivorans]